jgi:hypothetical protein
MNSDNEKERPTEAGLSKNGSRHDSDSRKDKGVASLPTRWRLLIRSDPYLSSQAKVLAYVLSTYMDNKTGACWPSHLSIARGCGWKITAGTTSCRSVTRATKELKENGYVSVTPRANTRETNVYKAIFPISAREKKEVLSVDTGVALTSSWGDTGSDSVSSELSSLELVTSKSSNREEVNSSGDRESPLPGYAPFSGDEDIPF